MTHADDPLSLTVDQSRKIDQAAVEQLAMPSLLLMENAGLNAGAAILDLIDHDLLIDRSEARVGIVTGAGNNAGDGFVIARHLHNCGVAVELVMLRAVDDLSDDALVNARICRAMALPMQYVTDNDMAKATTALAKVDVVVDAMLGTGITGAVREPMRSAIGLINVLDGPTVVAIDVPTGLNADTGQVEDVAVIADMTITMLAAKVGFDTADATHYVGKIVTADIGLPDWFVERIALAGRQSD